MNYGRKSTAKKEKELLSKGTMIRKKFTVIFAKTLLVCLIAFTVVGRLCRIWCVQGHCGFRP